MTTTAHLDRAMSDAGTMRTTRHDPHEVWEALGDLWMVHTGQSMTRNQAARIAMGSAGYTPAPRYKPQAIARRLAEVQADKEGLAAEVDDLSATAAEQEATITDLREEIAILRAQLPPTGDEPTEEAPAIALPDAPEGLEVVALNPSTPAAKAGQHWWTVRHPATHAALVRCYTREALSGALGALRLASWVNLTTDPDAADVALWAVSAAANIEGVERAP